MKRKCLLLAIMLLAALTSGAKVYIPLVKTVPPSTGSGAEARTSVRSDSYALWAYYEADTLIIQYPSPTVSTVAISNYYTDNVEIYKQYEETTLICIPITNLKLNESYCLTINAFDSWWVGYFDYQLQASVYEVKEITLKVGESCRLTVTPADANVRWIGESWRYSVYQGWPPYTCVAVVDDNGLVTALKPGNSVVLVQSMDGRIIEQCEIKVVDDGSILKDRKELDYIDEDFDWKDVVFTLTDDGYFTAEGTYYASATQPYYFLDWTLTDQCIFLSFEINLMDSTDTFCAQPFNLTLSDCNAREYNIYFNNQTHVLQTQFGIEKYTIKRGESVVGITHTDNSSQSGSGSDSPGQSGSDSDSIFNWKAVKLFDLPIDVVYNIYIDSVGVNSGGTEFCFQTKTDKLIKTDIKGNILSTEANPYTYFTCFGGDTLILKDEYIVNEKGDTIEISWKNGQTPYSNNYLAASESDIFIYINFFRDRHMVYKASDSVESKKDIFSVRTGSGGLAGLCCCEGYVFSLLSPQEDNGILTSRKEDCSDEKFEEEIPVLHPAGIAGYRGYLYVYSNADKALYRLERPNGSGVIDTVQTVNDDDNNPDDNDGNDSYQEQVYPLNLDYVEIPGRMYIKKDPGVSKNYVISLLEKQFNGNYSIECWIGDIICRIIVEDSLIDDAVTEFLKSDSIDLARRIYASRVDYENYLNHTLAYTYLEDIELCIYNEISYGVKRGYDKMFIDSVARELGLINNPNKYFPERSGIFVVPKTVDYNNFLALCRTLYETGCFTWIFPEFLAKINNEFPDRTTSIIDIGSPDVKVVERLYYNLSGNRSNNPRGITIVVTRFSDGSIRTEKQLFK